MKRTLFSILVGLSAATAAQHLKADAFVVSDIRVEGLQRVSAGTVFSAFPVEVGDALETDALADAIRALFRTGLFTDLSVARDNGVLVVSVVERPAISKIEIEGNKAIETDQLMNALKSAGLQEGQVFKRATLERLELEILRSYVAQGRYSARVKAEVTELPRNRVEVLLKISEGDVAAIQHINLIGNSAFDEETLTDLLQLKTTSWWRSITNADKYAREKLSGDLESLRSHYLDNGYLRFSAESTQVSISPDKQQVFITIAVNEGPQYKVRDVLIRGDTIVPEEELRKLLLLKPGEVFSRERATLTSELLSKRLGREGYTFANVNAIPEAHDDNTATVTFFVEPGKRTYVRRVNFRGNVATRDEVLRQEMVQLEGAVASTDLIEESRTRLERLGYFKTVSVETPMVAGLDDQVDVNYSVEEQPTGSLSASLGFSQVSGFIFGVNVSENNFFGSGKRASFGVNTSRAVKSANISFLDPYYTVDGVSRGFSVFAKQTDFAEEDISSYVLDNYGARLTFGYPVSSTARLNFGVGYSLAQVKVNDRPAIEVSNFLRQNGDSYHSFLATGSWVRSTLNRGILPTAGTRQALGVEVAVPGSDITYYRFTYDDNYYFPLNDVQTWVVRLRSNLGWGDGYGSSKVMPFFEHFFAGGFGSVRGYEANSLGPRATPHPLDPSDPAPFGGNIEVEGGAELIFPMPFVKDARSMRSSFFVEGGNVFDVDRGYDPAINELRYSAGIGFQWITPIGPLAFSLAKPLNKKPGDDTQMFQFSLGQQF